MSILKKTIAGALTIALSVGAIGTSAMPVLAASENNIDILQKNVEKAQEEYDRAETAYDNGAIKFLESKMCDKHKETLNYKQYLNNIQNATGKNAEELHDAMEKREKEFTTADGKEDIQKKKAYAKGWISFDNLRLQSEWLNELNHKRANDTNEQAIKELKRGYSNAPLKLNPELIMDSMMAAMIWEYSDNPHTLFHSNVPHQSYFGVSENLNGRIEHSMEDWFDEELKIFNAGNRDKNDIGHYLNCMENDDIVGFGIYRDRGTGKYGASAMRKTFLAPEENSYTADEWLKMVNEKEAPLKKNLDEAKANLDAAKKALEEAKKKEDIAVNKIVLSASKYTYNGKTHTPSVKVYDQKGKMLSADQYTVKYSSGRKNLGSYTVEVYGKGDTTGTASAKYVITPAKMKTPSVKSGKKKLTVKWKKLGGGRQSYQIYVLKKGTKKAKYYTSTGSSKTIKKLSKKKYYYTKIRSYKKINGKTYYGSWSGTKKVKVK